MTTPIVPIITDEHLKELESAFENQYCTVPGNLLAGIVMRLRADEKDAARYRWLRDSAKHHTGQAPAIVMLTEYCQPAFDDVGSAHLSLLYGEHAEIAIDNAMEQSK